jgi:hypothetical protein
MALPPSKVKVVVRRLPPALSEEGFRAAAGLLADLPHDWFAYYPGKVRCGSGPSLHHTPVACKRPTRNADAHLHAWHWSALHAPLERSISAHPHGPPPPRMLVKIPSRACTTHPRPHLAHTPTDAPHAPPCTCTPMRSPCAAPRSRASAAPASTSRIRRACLRSRPRSTATCLWAARAASTGASWSTRRTRRRRRLRPRRTSAMGRSRPVRPCMG